MTDIDFSLLSQGTLASLTVDERRMYCWQDEIYDNGVFTPEHPFTFSVPATDKSYVATCSISDNPDLLMEDSKCHGCGGDDELTPFEVEVIDIHRDHVNMGRGSTELPESTKEILRPKLQNALHVFLLGENRCFCIVCSHHLEARIRELAEMSDFELL